MGIDEKGICQILGFYVGGHESSNGWREVLKDPKRRGATDVLLGVFDGLPGPEEAFREIYPKADVQHCVVHKVRATSSKIRTVDKTAFLDDLKLVYTATDGGCCTGSIRWLQGYLGQNISEGSKVLGGSIVHATNFL